MLPSEAHARGECLTDAMIDDAVGAQVRAGAFMVDTSSLPDIPLCSGLTLAQQIQRIRAEAFPEEQRQAEERRAALIERERAAALSAASPLSIEPEETQPSVVPPPVHAVSQPAPKKKAVSSRKKVQGSAYYPSCRAARAAGVAPLYRGDPGYSTRLDRDRDGIACE